MPGMAYLEQKGSLVTKGNKIKGSAPTLYDTRNSRCLVHNPNDVLSPFRLFELTPIKNLSTATRAIASSLTSMLVSPTVVGSR